jgi:hypothetical protein
MLTRKTTGTPKTFNNQVTATAATAKETADLFAGLKTTQRIQGCPGEKACSILSYFYIKARIWNTDS